MVWKLDFVKIVRMSKNLNKDYNLSTKPLYHENLTHGRRTWVSYDKPTPYLDGYLRYSEKYKVTSLLYVSFNLVLKINLWTFLIIFIVLHCPTIQGDVEAYVQH
jgi:hypothetical protein